LGGDGKGGRGKRGESAICKRNKKQKKIQIDSAAAGSGKKKQSLGAPMGIQGTVCQNEQVSYRKERKGHQKNDGYGNRGLRNRRKWVCAFRGRIQKRRRFRKGKRVHAPMGVLTAFTNNSQHLLRETPTHKTMENPWVDRPKVHLELSEKRGIF